MIKKKKGIEAEWLSTMIINEMIIIHNISLKRIGTFWDQKKKELKLIKKNKSPKKEEK